MTRMFVHVLACMQEVGSASGELASAAAAPPSFAPVRVTTGQELISAVSAGERHIRVMDHIDLTSEELPWADVDAHLGHPSSSTHTITVRHLSMVRSQELFYQHYQLQKVTPKTSTALSGWFFFLH